MGEKRRNSLCIFCYKPTSSLNNSHKVLQILSRYLNIGLIPLESLIESELLICDTCFQLGENLCDLFVQFENSRLLLEWKLVNLFETMITAGRIPSRVHKFRTQFQNEEDDSKLVCDKIQQLRSQVFWGCKKKLSSSLPKVIVEKTAEGESECEIQNVFELAQLETSQLLEGLMTFLAVIHLSLPLHPHVVPKGYHSLFQNKDKIKYGRVDNQVNVNVNVSGVDAAPVVTEGVMKPIEPLSNVFGKQVTLATTSTIKCPSCSATLNSIVLLTLHMRSIHKTKTPFECPRSDCDYYTQSTVAFRVHMRRVHNSVTGIPGHFKCLTCQENFPSARTLRRHASVHRKTAQTRFKCEKCPQSFDNKSKLKSHIYHIHRPSQRRKQCRKTQHSISSPFDSYLRERNQQLLERKNASCKVAKKPTGHFSLQTKTTGAGSNSVGKLVENPTALVTNSVTDKTPIQNNNQKLFQCRWKGCQKKFATSGGRSRHNKTHTNCNAFQCQLCKKSYSLRCNLSRHLRITHGFRFGSPNSNEMPGQKRPDDDDDVGIAVPPKEAIKANQLIENPTSNDKSPQVRNNSSVSNQRKESVCCNFEGCSRSFTRRYDLQRHYRTHTGEKPYLCWWPGCTSKFANNKNRKGHYETHTKQQPPSKVDKASTVQVKVKRKWMRGRGNHNEIQKAQQSFDEVVERIGVRRNLSQEKTSGGSDDVNRRESREDASDAVLRNSSLAGSVPLTYYTQQRTMHHKGDLN